MQENDKMNEDRCAQKGCNNKGSAEVIHHHHDDYDCPIQDEDANHCIYWLCQKHLDDIGLNE